jgi:2-formylbenzoate dehydrogenase
MDRTYAADRDWRAVLGGHLRSAAGGATYETVDPATEDILAAVPQCSAADIDAAVAAAGQAQRAWAGLGPRARAAHVREFAGLLRENADELAMLDALDAGLPVAAMRTDVAFAIDYIEIMCDLALQLGGQTIPATAEHLHYTVREPFGVVARIVPYNHPLFFAAAKLAPPLVAGNAVILKAPDQAPLSALRIGELAQEALPPGLVSVVSGTGATTGRALVQHPRIRRIAFIGSGATGRLIQRDAADTGVKEVSLELGGKNAMIVFADADPAAAAAGAVAGMNFVTTAGQSCGSTSRLLVHESLAADVCKHVAAGAETVVVGDPAQERTQMGPVITRGHLDHVERLIEAGLREGAQLLTGGGRPAGRGDRGYYIAPTVLTGVAPDSTLGQTEVFGPVLSVMTFRDEDEAVRIANSVPFGLTGAVWTSDVRRAHRVARNLEAGYIWINGSARHFWGVPFGGFKDSGIGREESLEELQSFTQVKAVSVILG